MNLRIVVILIHSLLLPCNAYGDIIDVVAAVDGDGFTRGNSGVALNTNRDFVRTANRAIFDQKGLFEFDLSNVSGSSLSSAQLNLTLDGSLLRVGRQSELQIDFYGFIGNGTLEAADYFAPAEFVGSINLQETSAGGPAAGETVTIDLDTTLVQQIVDSGGIFGIRSQQSLGASVMNIVSLESSSPGKPTLSLGITAVPEPSSLSLVLAGLALTLRRRRTWA